MRLNVTTAAAALAALCLAGCARERREATATASPEPPPALEQAPSPGAPGGAPVRGGGASAELAPTQGNQARGTVTFEPGDEGLRITAHLEGLQPGVHGFHLHENGDCSAPDASSAGEHWNPTQQPHGSPQAAQRHLGDLGNVTADADGNAHLSTVVSGLGLEAEHSVMGRAVVVHARPDDFVTQPSGNAGARVACGVVKPGLRRVSEG